MQLTDFTDEALQKELERRAQAALTPNRPPMKVAIDSTELRKICKDYLIECERGLSTDSDTPHFIFEAALEMLYGKDVWKYVNALLK